MVSQRKLFPPLLLLLLCSWTLADVHFSTIDQGGLNVVGVGISVRLTTESYPVVAYYDHTEGDLKFAHCNDLNCTSVDLLAIESAGTVGRFPSMVLDGMGIPFICYLNSTGSYMKIVSCGNDRCSTGNIIEAPDIGVEAMETPMSLQLDILGNPIIAYIDVAGFDYDLRVIHCMTSTCSTVTKSSPIPARRTVRAISMQLTQSGFPVITHATNDIQERLEIFLCGNIDCNDGDSVVLRVGKAGSYASLQLQPISDQPVVSMYDDDSNDLVLILCAGPANCTSDVVVTTIDSDGDVGTYNSLQLDENKFPVIAYFDTSGLDLKLCHCTSVDCTTGNIIKTLRPLVSSGAYVSMILDSLGYPVMVEEVINGGDLGLVRCSDPLCTKSSASPTSTPTTSSPTAQPSSAPSASPSALPTISPSLNPTVQPTAQPTKLPSASPSRAPSNGPTKSPSVAPSVQPSTAPTLGPSMSPSQFPTNTPSRTPSAAPTQSPSASPSRTPSSVPTLLPSFSPSTQPSSNPTTGPTESPSQAPTRLPTASPSVSPTQIPTAQPSRSPSATPTLSPTVRPGLPTKSPTTRVPSVAPSQAPSTAPTVLPTATPNSSPSTSPSTVPSTSPTFNPTKNPTTLRPSTSPTDSPTLISAAPSKAPTQSTTLAPTVAIPPVPGDLVIPGNVILLAPVDASMGNLVIDGSLTLTSNLTVSSARPVNVSGAVVLGGNLVLSLDSKPVPGSQVPVFLSPSSAQGRFDSIEVTFAGQRSCEQVTASDSMANTGFSVSVNVVDNCGDGLPPAALAGIVVGAVLVVAGTLGTYLLVKYLRTKRRARSDLKRLRDAVEMKDNQEI